MKTTTKKLLTATVLAASAMTGFTVQAQPASASTYPCQSSRLSQHTTSYATAAGQDGDGVWHYANYKLGISGSASNYSGGDCAGTTWIAMDYGVTGQYLSNNGFGWTERVSYLNPLDGKYHGMSRQYSSISNPWHWYHDGASPAVYGMRISKVRLSFTATYNGSLAASRTITCNLATNTCS